MAPREREVLERIARTYDLSDNDPVWVVAGIALATVRQVPMNPAVEQEQGTSIMLGSLFAAFGLIGAIIGYVICYFTH